VGYLVINIENARKIIHFYKKGASLRMIAAIKGLSKTTVQKIVSGKHLYSRTITYTHSPRHISLELSQNEYKRYLEVKKKGE
jgi:hypothetical protein